MATYPTYRTGADFAHRELLPLADDNGDAETRRLILVTVARNLPDHPLARAAKREQAVGK